MLYDYVVYLERVCSSLNRCGVSAPMVIVGDYSYVFDMGYMLGDLLWYYSVLGVSGSSCALEGFLFPLNSFYVGDRGSEYYSDYLRYRGEYLSCDSSDEYVDWGTLSFEEDDGSTCIEGYSSSCGTLDADYSTLASVEGVEEDFPEWGTDDEGDDFVSYGEEDYEDGVKYSVPDSTFMDSSYSEGVGIVMGGDEFTSEDVVEADTDDGIVWGNDEDFPEWGGSDEDEEEEDGLVEEEADDFSDWGAGREEEEASSLNGYSSDIEYGEDEDFPEWGSREEEEEEVSDSGGKAEAFSNWDDFFSDDDSSDWDSSSDSSSSDVKDDCSDWGSSNDSFEEYIGDLGTDGEEDDFPEWGTDDNDSFEEYVGGLGTDDSSLGSSSDEYEDDFSDWGSNDNEDSEDSLDTSDEYEDDFSDWGSGEEEEGDLDTSSDCEEYDDDFGNWGSSEESGTVSEYSDGGGFAGETVTPVSIENSSNGIKPVSKKSKLECEIESNEKTAKVIEKIASSLLFGGTLLKNKVADRIKNMGENTD